MAKPKDNPADDLTPIGNLPGGPTREKHDPINRGGKRRPKKMARGGGVEIRGKTRGKFV